MTFFFGLAAEGSAQGLTVTLTPSNYNGFAVSCFGAKDGTISATVSGGTPPYTYNWSHGDSTQQVSGLASGFYRVTVNDADTLSGTADITLMEPLELKVLLTPFQYPSGHNISCYECYNGSIQTSVMGGIPGYAYLWNDDVTSAHRTYLGHNVNYEVRVTDANGCVAESEKLMLTQPERSDWTMAGNAGTDPAEHYLGTSDSTDLVLKSNGQERLRLNGNGEVKLNSPVLGAGPVYLDGNGTLRSGLIQVAPMPVDPCAEDLGLFEYWRPDGNHFQYPQCDPDVVPKLGSLSPNPVRFITNGSERMRITTDGKVGIGTVPPNGAIDGYRLFVEDGIATRDVLVKVGPWPDYVFADGYRLMPLCELRDFLMRNRHLPGIPSAAVLEEHGGVAIGEMQRNLVRTVEEQALYILELKEEVEELKRLMYKILQNR